MSHIFDPHQFSKLDSPQRLEALPPDLVCDLVLLSSDMQVADVGCGTGFFAIPMAKRVHTLYAIDISPIMVKEFKHRIPGQTNLHVACGDFKDLLAPNSLDVFFTATVIHELDDLESFTRNALKTLKKGGKLVYLDFKKESSSFGPPLERRIASEVVVSLFQKLGLSQVVDLDVKESFYLVSGIK